MAICGYDTGTATGAGTGTGNGTFAFCSAIQFFDLAARMRCDSVSVSHGMGGVRIDCLEFGLTKMPS